MRLLSMIGPSKCPHKIGTLSIRRLRLGVFTWDARDWGSFIMHMRSVMAGAVVIGLGALLLGSPTAASARVSEPATGAHPRKMSQPSFSAAQLDQLLAPIDLYSDALLWQIFRGATHPRDVVEAARWLQEPAHARLRSDELARATLGLPWDASVKALVSEPRVLLMMSEHVYWMQRLAAAFMADPGELTEAIQRLRRSARDAGTFDAMPAQTISVVGQTIAIQPTPSGAPNVPNYDPTTAFGLWPYPGFPPFFSAAVLGVARTNPKANNVDHVSRIASNAASPLPESTAAEDFRRLPTGEIVAMSTSNRVTRATDGVPDDVIQRSPTGELRPAPNPSSGSASNAVSRLPRTTEAVDVHRLPTGELALAPQSADTPRSNSRGMAQGSGAVSAVAPVSSHALPKTFSASPMVRSPVIPAQPRVTPAAVTHAAPAAQTHVAPVPASKKKP
jgi:uncharacterized protein DUF3300